MSAPAPWSPVEIDKLWCGEECGPVSPGEVVLGPLVAPGLAQEALRRPHVGPRQGAGAEPLHQRHHQAQQQRHALHQDEHLDEQLNIFRNPS